MPFIRVEHWTIAICDDDEIFLSRLEKQIRAELQCLQVGKLYHTWRAEIAGTKLHQTEIFSDIDKNEVTGMELAAKLEEQNPQAIVIFISNHEEAVFEARFTISHFVSLEKRIYRRNFRKRWKAWKNRRRRVTKHDVKEQQIVLP